MVLRAARSFGIARHWQPVPKIYVIPLTTSRRLTECLLPPQLGRQNEGCDLRVDRLWRSSVVIQVGLVAQPAATIAAAVLLGPHVVPLVCMQGAQNGNRFDELKRELLTNSKDSICSWTDIQGGCA